MGGAEKAAASAQSAAEAAAEAACRAAVSAERASLLLHEVVSGPFTGRPSAQRAGDLPANPWNRFQQMNAGKGWTMDKMRAEYFRAKCHRNLP